MSTSRRGSRCSQPGMHAAGTWVHVPGTHHGHMAAGLIALGCVAVTAIADLPWRGHESHDMTPTSRKPLTLTLCRYIAGDNAIILAVSPANADMATSDAIRMAREVRAFRAAEGPAAACVPAASTALACSPSTRLLRQRMGHRCALSPFSWVDPPKRVIFLLDER